MNARTPTLGLEQMFRALADRTRLRLLNLMDGQEICVCYLVEITGEGQPKISRHLAYLRRAGIVAARREGKWMHYRITAPREHAAKQVLDAALATLREDKTMQADRARLTRACCGQEQSNATRCAPLPRSLASPPPGQKECRLP